jgi:hypothetical protein
MKRLIFSLAIIFIATSCFAQTAEEIVNKHLEATGGADKWREVKSVYREGVAVMQNGNEITSKISTIQNEVIRREVNFGMGSMTMIVTPKQGWFSNPRSGGAFEDMPADMLKNQLMELDINPLLDYEKEGSKVELLGKETIDGKEVFKLKYVPASGTEQTMFIDANTYYITRTSFKGLRGGRRQNQDNPAQETEIVVTYSNHEKTPSGLVFPFTISQGMGGSMTFEKIEVNPELDAQKLLSRDK